MTFLKSSLPSDRSDLELLRDYQETKNLDLLASLFERYLDLIYGVCLKYLEDPDESKDATMQVFEKLKDTDLIGVTNIGGWLHVVTRNHCLMKIRSEKSRINRNQAFASDMEMSYSLHHMDEDEIPEDTGALQKAMTKLPLEQKSCIDLFYLQQKCYREVAEITGFDLKQVKSYLQNGKRNLKLILSERDGQRS